MSMSYKWQRCTKEMKLRLGKCAIGPTKILNLPFTAVSNLFLYTQPDRFDVFCEPKNTDPEKLLYALLFRKQQTVKSVPHVL